MILVGRPLDLTGCRFGRLVVIEQVPTSALDNKRRWLCRCDCGNTLITTTQNLRKGDTKSCGCFKHDSTVARMLKHGDTGTHLYNVWKAKRKRCYNDRNTDYKYYGGRGIRVCDELNSDFESFKRWAVSHGYSPELTIDRINSDKDYSPSNCRWITMKSQCNNRRNNITYSFNNETHTLSEWSEIADIPYHTLYMRLHNGWDFNKAITT